MHSYNTQKHLYLFPIDEMLYLHPDYHEYHSLYHKLNQKFLLIHCKNQDLCHPIMSFANHSIQFVSLRYQTDIEIH